jgi:hypothetical protein
MSRLRVTQSPGPMSRAMGERTGDVDVQLPQQRGRDGQGRVGLEGFGDGEMFTAVNPTERRFPGDGPYSHSGCIRRGVQISHPLGTIA